MIATLSEKLNTVEKKASTIIKPATDYISAHDKIFTSLVVATAVFTTMKLYDASKIKTAKQNIDSKDPLKAKLASLDAKLNNPALSNSDRKTLEAERDMVITIIVAEYFKDKNFVDSLVTIFKALLPK